MTIEDYLLKNPIDRTQQNPYDQAALQLGIDKEVVRRKWRTLRRKGLVENEYQIKNPKLPFVGEIFKSNGDTAETVRFTNRRVKTLDDLIEVCEIDQEAWEIINWECNKWEVGAKNNEGKIEVSPLFQVKAKLRIRKLDTDLGLQKELILEEIKKYVPAVEYDLNPGVVDLGDCLYEIAIPDLHIGKLAWGKEVGEDYDIKIAVERYKNAVETLLHRVDISVIGRILLPIGNDMINIDNNANTTTGGTPQSADSRFGKMFLTAKNLLIETIDRLALIAPVDVVIVPGNHDNLTMFTLGEVLSAWYHNTSHITIDNSPKLRKYYKYGNTSIQFTHGNQEKHLELGLIFATEEPKMWADTKFRFCQLGHFHHTKKTQYISVEEHQGFQVQIIPSLSGTDAWHYGKGYNALKQAKAFLIDKEEGVVGEFTHAIYINK